MPLSSNYFFNEKSNTDQIAVVLWKEKLPDNYYDILLQSGYGFITSPLHEPDGTNNKPHVHCIIRNMHGHKLSYERVHDLIEKLNPNSSQAIILRGGHAGLVSMARYFVHLDNPEKQQFDLRFPGAFDTFTVDDDGKCSDTGLVSIYSEGKCFYDGNGLDFIKLIHLTARELADLRKKKLREQLYQCLDYIYENEVISYAKFVKWAKSENLLDAVVAYNSLLNNVVRSNGDKKLTSDFGSSDSDCSGSEQYTSDVKENYNSSTCDPMSDFDYTAVDDRDIDDTKAAVLSACEVSDIDTDYIKWFCWLFPYIAKTDIKYNKMYVRRRFTEYFDLYNNCPRVKFADLFNNFATTHLHYMLF